ncbi:hypothetical protein F2Q68_00021746 [Brassica cretica]|uniref:Uncharacterized protein n=1 Tax=Brassica cretica TaxID=69181 RepID=A0A8S9FS14_BRACR|nr:hypothetical protein F2Q68_00021746 [Brassica cretica]
MTLVDVEVVPSIDVAVLVSIVVEVVVVIDAEHHQEISKGRLFQCPPNWHFILLTPRHEILKLFDMVYGILVRKTLEGLLTYPIIPLSAQVKVINLSNNNHIRDHSTLSIN